MGLYGIVASDEEYIMWNSDADEWVDWEDDELGDYDFDDEDDWEDDDYVY